MKSTLLIWFVCNVFCTAVFAQNNVLGERSYWKNNPSLDDVKQKIAEGHDASALNPYAFDPVTWAILENSPNETIEFLLKQKGNGVNKLTHDGRTYLFWAAYKDNLQLMQYLLKNGAKTTIVDTHGNSVINFAAATGQLNTKIYDLCIAHGMTITNQKNTRSGANPLLLIAPYTMDFKIINYFESKGLSIHSEDKDGNGIFNYAAKTGNIEMLNKLIAKGVAYKALNNVAGNAMIFASRGTRGVINTLAFYQYLEGLGIAPNVTTTSGLTPLHALAYRCEDQAIFEYFFRKGVAVNQANDDGNTLLSIAMAYNTPEMVAFLIDKGANLSVVDKKGNSLIGKLFYAYSDKNSNVFEKKLALLESMNIDVKKTQEKGNTLFHIAIEKNSDYLVQKAKKLGIDLNKRNNEGLTALHLAAMKTKNIALLEGLLKMGANKYVKTNFDESVFDLASENEQLTGKNINFLK
jgi:ankyrin repeat protein